MLGPRSFPLFSLLDSDSDNKGRKSRIGGRLTLAPNAAVHTGPMAKGSGWLTVRAVGRPGTAAARRRLRRNDSE
jgi:hypothetical protein